MEIAEKYPSVPHLSRLNRTRLLQGKCRTLLNTTVLRKMKLTHDPCKTEEFQFSVEPFSAAAKAAVDAIRNWHNRTDLARFAHDRHGYGNSDGYFGIRYPGDLDEFEQANGESIPEGTVEAYARYGAANNETHLLSELEYLDLLSQYFAACGQHDLAANIETLRNGNAEHDADGKASPAIA